METSASQAMVEAAALVMARVFCPRRRAFAQGRQRVRGLAGLRKHQHAGMAHIRLGIAAAATVLAGIFHIDGQAAQVFKHDLGSQAAVAAGAGGGNQNFALGNGPAGQQGGNVRFEGVVGQIKPEGVAQRQRLLVDFAQHLVIEGGIVQIRGHFSVKRRHHIDHTARNRSIKLIEQRK
jgi:hypothetical protein